MIQKDLLEKKTFAVDIDGTITLNGMGTIHLEALSRLRSLKDDGHNVVLVTGRSSVEGYLLSIFGGFLFNLIPIFDNSFIRTSS